MKLNAKQDAMHKTWHPPKLLPAIKLTVLLSCLTLTQLSAKAKNAIPGHNNFAYLSKKQVITVKRSKFAISLKGIIKDEAGATLPGVSITLTGNGFKQTASTNDKGEYSFSVPKAGNYTLTASFVGYNKLSQSITIGSDAVTKNLSLVPSNQELQEVMVVAYGKQTKASFTGSAKELKGAVISGSSRASVQESLQGNVAGLVSSNGSGQPGAIPSIRIRGIGSFNAGSGPLYVVDGIPLDANQISGLNSYDVENVTVLKDASAASIYGSRAANGVILITTKVAQQAKLLFLLQYKVGLITL